MSHVATIDIEIRDLDALDAACKRLGLELVCGQTTYKWFGRHVGDYPLPEGFTAKDLGKCDHAIRIPGKPKAYEIGVVERRDGKPGYALQWDFFAGGKGMQKVAGDDCAKLQQAYATEAAKAAAVAQGFSVTEQQTHDGTIRIVATEGGY